MSLVQDDHVVEELAADAADRALGEGVLPAGAWFRENLGDAHAIHPSPKISSVRSRRGKGFAPVQVRRMVG
jgi:hypothetical protein